jgi:hypothetical protein
LQRLAFLVMEVSDGLDVLVRQVGDEASDIVAGMLALLAPLKGGQERSEEGFQAGQDAAEDAGIDLGIGQQLVTAGRQAACHRSLPSEDSVLQKGFVAKDLPPVK